MSSDFFKTVIIEFIFDNNDIYNKEEICVRNIHNVPIEKVKFMHKSFREFDFKKLPKLYNKDIIHVYQIKKIFSNDKYIIKSLSFNNEDIKNNITRENIVNYINEDLLKKDWINNDSYPVFIMRGIPGSGKSTFIENFENILSDC